MDFSPQVIPRAPCGCLATTAALGGEGGRVGKSGHSAIQL